MPFVAHLEKKKKWGSYRSLPRCRWCWREKKTKLRCSPWWLGDWWGRAASAAVSEITEWRGNNILALLVLPLYHGNICVFVFWCRFENRNLAALFAPVEILRLHFILLLRLTFCVVVTKLETRHSEEGWVYAKELVFHFSIPPPLISTTSNGHNPVTKLS